MSEEKCDKGKDPKKCSPEQIKKCHGDAKEHSCEEPSDKKQDLTSKQQAEST